MVCLGHLALRSFLLLFALHFADQAAHAAGVGQLDAANTQSAVKRAIVLVKDAGGAQVVGGLGVLLVVVNED